MQGPSGCATRGRAEDAADAAREMAGVMARMDPAVVRQMVRAREAAVGVLDVFPAGDQRFAAVESSDEEDGMAPEEEIDGEDVDGGSEKGAGGDTCVGLLDDAVDKSPAACLARVERDYGLDLIAEMDAGGLDFFARIRLVNYMRAAVRDGMVAAEVVRKAQKIMEEKLPSVLEDDALLTPVVEGDVLLTALEGEECDDEDGVDDSADIAQAVENSLQVNSAWQ